MKIRVICAAAVLLVGFLLFGEPVSAQGVPAFEHQIDALRSDSKTDILEINDAESEDRGGIAPLSAIVTVARRDFAKSN
jgi:hypothetical protein